MRTPHSTLRAIRLCLSLLLALAASTGALSARAATHEPTHLGTTHPAAGQVTLTLTARADAGIASPRPDDPLGTEPDLRVYHSGPDEYGHALLYFTVQDELPLGAVVDSATLMLYLVGTSGADPIGLIARNVLDYWDPLGVTWNTRPTTGNPTYTNLTVDAIYPADKSLDVTGIVSAWLQGTNYGLELSGAEGAADPRFSRVFHSVDEGSYEPQLQVTYHLPPGDWANFVPAGWVTTQTVTCSAQLQSAAGLASAQYHFSTNGGAGWNGPFTAQESSAGSTWTVTATNVPFGHDTIGGSNLIRFQVQDTLGVYATSTHTVLIDATPPSAPASLGGSVSASTWLNQASAVMSWSGAYDAASGIQGYAYAWSQSPGTVPAPALVTGASSASAPIPGDGANWYFHVRTVDGAGNWSTGAAHLGPFYLDTAPPTNPTSLSSGYHIPGLWSPNKTVNCGWSGATDALSGVAGYSYVWDHSATTVPDTVIDTTSAAASSPVLDDGIWYFHVRTIDQAGNAAAGSTHIGPLKIDTIPPSSWVLPLNPTQESAEFTVTWEGFAGTGAPITGYDVRVADQYGSSVTVSDWLSGTSATSSVFSNARRGHTYHFQCRARDAAGNLEAYPMYSDTSTYIGRNTEVLVRDEWGSSRVGAKDYHHGQFGGLTNAQGKITLPDALAGDEIIALYQVLEHASPRASHARDGSRDWNWRVYQTNISYSNAGTPQPHVIAHTDLAQQVTVYRSRPLIGFHTVVSVQWDATAAYLQALRYGIENASAYLYDVTDGQMFWDVVEVFDGDQMVPVTDLRIVAAGGRAHAGVGEIESKTGRMVLYRPFVTMNISGGNPGLEGGARTIVHEFGHYGLHLWDEYRDRDGAEGTGAFCASNLNLHSSQPYASSIMNNQGVTSELCSRVDPNHQHMANTSHDAVTGGESTWETVLRFYRDTQSPALWTLNSPDTRGYVMPGPNAVPAPDWTTIYVTDSGSGSCPPFTVTVSDMVEGKAMAGVTVHVVQQSGNWLPQGTTNNAGQILIVGANNGDAILAVAPYKVGLLSVSICADNGNQSRCGSHGTR